MFYMLLLCSCEVMICLCMCLGLSVCGLYQIKEILCIMFMFCVFVVVFCK